MEKWSNLLLHIAEVLDERVYDLLYPGHFLERKALGAAESDSDEDDDLYAKLKLEVLTAAEEKRQYEERLAKGLDAGPPPAVVSDDNDAI